MVLTPDSEYLDHSIKWKTGAWPFVYCLADGLPI